MACSQTKPKGRKRKLLPSDYTEFGDPHSLRNQQSRDQQHFSGISDIEKDSLGELSDRRNGQKIRTSLPEVLNFHGDFLPLSQAGKFIPKFQTKVIRKIKTDSTMKGEYVRKKGSFLSDACMKNKGSTKTESLDCNFQQCLETHSMNASKDNSEPDTLLFNEKSKQTVDYTSHTFAGVEIAAPLKRKLNLTRNNGHDELDSGTTEKKKGKGRLQQLFEKTLGIRKVKSTGVIPMISANNSCITNGMEGKTMTTVNKLDSAAVVSEELNLERSATGNSENESAKTSEKRNSSSDNMSNIADINENFDGINSRIEAFEQKLVAADVVQIERLELSEKESNNSNIPQLELLAAQDESENDSSSINQNLYILNVTSNSPGQQPLDACEDNASSEIDSKVVNNSQLSLSSSRHSEVGDRIKKSVRSQKVDGSCSESSQKAAQISATMPTTYKLEASENRPQRSPDTEEVNSINCKPKETLPRKTEPTTQNCTVSCMFLDAELSNVPNMTFAEKYSTEAVEICEENKFIADLGSSSVGKSTEVTTQLQSQFDLPLQKSNGLGQENYTIQETAHQELYSTFDDFPDVTDSQMYLLDEESVTKPTLSSSTNMPMPSPGTLCPGLANLSKALDIMVSADLVDINEAKRREGNKILQNLIKELTSVNAQLIQYRRQIEKAKKERLEHLRSNSCARPY